MPEGAYLGRSYFVIDGDAEPLERELDKAEARAALRNREMARHAKAATDEIVAEQARGAKAYESQGAAIEKVTEKVRKASDERVQQAQRVESTVIRSDQVLSRSRKQAEEDAERDLELTKLREQAQGRLHAAEEDAAAARQRSRGVDRDGNREAAREYQKILDAHDEGYKLTEKDLEQANARMAQRRNEAAAARDQAQLYEREAANLRVVLRELEQLNEERQRTAQVHESQARRTTEGQQYIDELAATNAPKTDIRRATSYAKRLQENLDRTAAQLDQVNAVIEERTGLLQELVDSTETIAGHGFFSERNKALREAEDQRTRVRMRELDRVEGAARRMVPVGVSQGGPLGGPGADFSPQVDLGPQPTGRGFASAKSISEMTPEELQAQDAWWTAIRSSDQRSHRMRLAGKTSYRPSGAGVPFAGGADVDVEMFHGAPGPHRTTFGDFQGGLDIRKVLREGLRTPGTDMGVYLSPEAYKSAVFQGVLGYLFRVRGRASEIGGGIAPGEEAMPGLDDGEMISEGPIHPRHIELLDRTTFGPAPEMDEPLRERVPKAFTAPITEGEDPTASRGYTINVAQAKELRRALSSIVREGKAGKGPAMDEMEVWDPELNRAPGQIVAEGGMKRDRALEHYIALRKDVDRWIKDYEAFQKGLPPLGPARELQIERHGGVMPPAPILPTEHGRDPHDYLRDPSFTPRTSLEQLKLALQQLRGRPPETTATAEAMEAAREGYLRDRMTPAGKSAHEQQQDRIAEWREGKLTPSTAKAGREVEGVKGPDRVGSRQNPEVVTIKSGRSAGLSAAESPDLTDQAAGDQPPGALLAEALERATPGRDREMRQPFRVGEMVTVDLSDDSINRISDAMAANLLRPMEDIARRVGAPSPDAARQFALESTGSRHKLYELDPEGRRRQIAESTSLDAIKAALRQAEMGRTRNEMSMREAAQALGRGEQIGIGDRPRVGGKPISNQEIADRYLRSIDPERMKLAAAQIQAGQKVTERPRDAHGHYLPDPEIIRLAEALRENTAAQIADTRATERQAFKERYIGHEWNEAAYMQPAAAGGGEGGGPPPIAIGPSFGMPGDNRPMKERILGGLMGHKHTHGRPPGWIGYLLGPAIGAGAAFGSAASFAGFGTEHILTTLGGIVGSGVAGAAGGGLLAAGAAGQFAVGAGSDAAVMHSTIADTKTLGQSYMKLQEAVAKYGEGSKQATAAQKLLNFQMKELGGGPGVQAEMRLAKEKFALGKFWDEATAGARVQTTKVLEQVMHLGRAYIPLVARAAEQNYSIINKSIKPLFGWLQGPEGMGIFRTLESRFQENLPRSIHATSQGLELLLKTIANMSQYTGGLTKKLDEFLTHANSPAGFAKWQDEMRRLVGTARDWGHFLSIAWKVLRDLFAQDTETGLTLVKTFTKLLEKLHEWELSTQGKQQIHSLFQVHKEEVVALVRAFAPLAAAFGHLYLTLAPPFTKAATGIATALAAVLEQINKLGPAASGLLGGALLAAKFGFLGKIVHGVGGAFGATGSEAAQAGNRAAAGATKATAALDAETAAARRLAAAMEQTYAVSKMGLPGPYITPWGKTMAPGFGERAHLYPGGGPPGLTAELQDAALMTMGREVRPPAGPLSRARSSLGEFFGTASAGIKGFDLGGRLLRGGTYGIGAAVATEMAGSALHLKKPVQNALTGAITGAATGAAFGPWGIAAGAVIGGALGGAFKLFAHHAPDYGRQFAKGFVAPLRGLETDRTAKEDEARLYKLQHESGLAQEAERKLRQRERDRGGGDTGFTGPVPGISQAERNATFNRRWMAEQRVGLASAEAAQHEFAGVQRKTPTALTLFTADRMSHMTGEARNAAGKAMLAYAAELEHKKELPKGSIHKMLVALEGEFPSFREYLRRQGAANSQEIASSMKLTRAEANLRTSLHNLKAEWGLFNVSDDVSGKKWIKNVGTSMNDLKALLKADPGNSVLKKRIEELRHSTAATFDGMLGDTRTKMHTFGQLLKGGMKDARPAAEHELQGFIGKVVGAEESGAISAKEAAKLIGDATNAELKALGAAPIPKAALPVVGGVESAAKKALTGITFAEGGLFQIGNRGEMGHDNIPLSVGGQGIVVGAGEQVAVFNRHQQMVMDHALAPMGGLEGMFSQVNTPHYMAGGGVVPMAKGGNLTSMVQMASAIDSRHFPYVFGGGHGSFAGPYDCSGAVSAVLHAGHLLSAPRDSTGLMSFGQPGPGAVTIYANPQHTYMSINGHYFGTSKSNPGGGAGWFDGAPRPGFAVRHVPDGILGGEGIGHISVKLPKGPGGPTHMAAASGRKMEKAANRQIDKAWAKFAAGAWGGGDVGEGGGGKAGTSAQMRGWAAAGLKAAGFPANAANMSAILYTMQHESGGNPRSENTTDSNARAGHPSRGLMELIPENFRTYHVPGTSTNVFDPVANVAAAVRYMVARYGRIVAKSPYATGGMVTAKGVKGALGPPRSAQHHDYHHFLEWAKAKLRREHKPTRYPPGRGISGSMEFEKLTRQFLGPAYLRSHADVTPWYAMADENKPGAWWGKWMRGETYGEGGLMPRFAGGGLLPGFFRGSHKATAASAKKPPPPHKAKAPKRSHVSRPKRAGKLSLGHLAMGLTEIPGFNDIAKELGLPEQHSNALEAEVGLLSEMAANPASLLVDDAPILAPTMPPGLNLPTPELITAAERQVAEYANAHGDSDNLAETSQLLGWIANKDDHRLIAKGQAGLLHVKNYIPFPAGTGVFPANLQVMQQQKLWLEVAARLELAQVRKAIDFIKTRQKRLHAMRQRIQRVYEHWHRLHRLLERVKLKASEAQFARAEAQHHFRAAEADLMAGIEDEKRLPKSEQNTKLIAGMESHLAHFRASHAAMEHASKAPVVIAQLKARIHPLEETLHGLGGASQHIGKAGRIGEVQKEVDTLQKGRHELEGQRESLVTEKLPKLTLSIEQMKEQLADSAASVRPKPIDKQTADSSQSAAKEQENALLKEQLAQSRLATAVSQKQYSVLAALPPFAGKFHTGGIVPGPLGSERMALVQAGERISQPGKEQQTIHVIVKDGAVDPNKIEVLAGNAARAVTRRMSVQATRGLPSRGGGV